jgi:hypothetical protein
MPASATFALLVALGLSFVDGMTGSWPLVLQHRLPSPSRTRRASLSAHADARFAWRGFILAVLYTGIIFIPHIGLLLALAGLAETIFITAPAPAVHLNPEIET